MADALSRKMHLDKEGEYYALNTVNPTWLDELQMSYDGDELVTTFISDIALTHVNMSLISLDGKVLRYKGKTYVGSVTDLRRQILKNLHESSMGSHYGVTTSYNILSLIFLWPGMRSMVKEFVLSYVVYQINKP